MKQTLKMAFISNAASLNNVFMLGYKKNRRLI